METNNKPEDGSLEFRLMRLVGYLGVPTAAMAYLLYYLFNNYIPSHEAINERRMSEIRSDYLSLQKIYAEQLSKLLADIHVIDIKLDKISSGCNDNSDKTK